MKIVLTKHNLLNAVNISLKAVPTRTTMSILESIVIDASEDQIKLVSNDMEMGIETIVEGDIIERGMVALDAKILSEIVRKFPESFITISVDENLETTITCEKAVFNIVGKRGEEFSFLPEVEKEKSIYISQFSLKEIIRQTIFSIADNDNNKLMTGELFEVNADELKVTSLDGHRISIRKIKLKESFENIKVIVPGKTLIEISKILSGEADSIVKIFFTRNHILFEFEKTKVVSRLIEGEYFKIDQMLSSDYETKIKINKKELFDCIERASLLIREGDKKPIIVTIEGDKAEIRIDTTTGSMEEDIFVEREGKEIKIGFNPKFIIDALRVIEEDEIEMFFVNPKAPCFIKNKEDKYTYLILPVNFSSASN